MENLQAIFLNEVASSNSVKQQVLFFDVVDIFYSIPYYDLIPKSTFPFCRKGEAGNVSSS